MQIFSAGRTGRDQPKVVQEVLADLKNTLYVIREIYVIYVILM